LKVDIEDVLFWMDAIRNSENRYRTLESFWKGQVNSKVWLAENLLEFVPVRPLNIVIYGGWNGVLASILFNSNIAVQRITSVDIDPVCEDIANTVNRRYLNENKFSAVTADMCEYTSDADVVINTSCEHLTQEQYDKWLSNIQPGTKVVLQSNNYVDLDEHIRCASSMEDFVKQSKVYVAYVGEFKTPKYTRYMIIGHKFNE
jgi:hypothetical protein